VTKTFPKTALRATLGIRNAFDKAPPRVTTLALGELDTQGNSAFYSQYDYYGRTFNGSISWEF
jgi:outer membrane receptor protein involved in Fe transport